MAKLQENWPLLGGTILPILTIDFSSFAETVFYAAIGTLTGAIVKLLFDRFIKKYFK